MPQFELTVSAPLAGCTLRHAALQVLHLSGGQFKQAKFHGSMTLDGAPALANTRLTEGQVLRLFVPEGENTLPEPCFQPLTVLYEDDHFLMIDKPAPMPTASSAKQTGVTLENVLYAYLGCPDPFVYRPVNRLDKGTSGLMLVARTAHAQHLLQQQLHSPSFVREYLAVVEGHLPQAEGLITLPIAKAEGATVRREVNPDGKEARTHYRVLEQRESRSLVRLRLDTGRTHQIRVHLSALGCPIVGDFLYGTETNELPGRFALHSTLCSVLHPITGETIQRESPLPIELERLLDKGMW